MPIELIVASSESRFRDFATEQISGTPGAQIISEHEDVGPNLAVRILQDVAAAPHAAVLLDISSDPEMGLRTLEQLKLGAPGVYVVLSDLKSSEEFLLRSMRLGSSDFLLQPLKRAEFSEAMSRLDLHTQRIYRQERPLGRMYTFAGVKGGVGATTVATNFAALCAKQNKSTVLLDLDMDTSDAASFLGLRHQYSIADVVDNIDQLDQAMLEGIMVRDPLGFYVLCAPDQVERARTIGEGQIREICSFLLERYDVVVVDGSHALDDLLLACLEQTEMIFLVFTPEFPAVRNAQHYLGALSRFGYGMEAVKLLLNRFEKKSGQYVTIEQIKQTLGTGPYFGFPNRYEEAMQALHEARPVVLKGKTELGKAYREFGRKVGIVSATSAAK